jgi:hypothetical protein
MPTESEIAWAAGLFEGEGCFSSSMGRERASMVSTDRDVLERFKEIVGCGTIGPGGKRQKSHHKVRWQWWANGDDFVRVFILLSPWLCQRRLSKGRAVLETRCSRQTRLCGTKCCENCGSEFKPAARGKTTRARVAGAVKSKFCTSKCRTDAKNRRRRERYNG